MPTSSSTRRSVAIVGARGYSGLELARLLLRHPQVELKACFATAGFQLSDYLPEAAATAVPGLSSEELLPMAQTGAFEVVFLATPVATSLELAPKLLDLGLDVIDLSGAFRLPAGDIANSYHKWYGFMHPAPRLVTAADYGLAAWASAASESGARLVANPGCFATAILLALLPLLKNGLIEPNSLVIDAKSGTSGAGRKAEERLLHAEVDGACLPYRVGRHQHLPEIQQVAERLTGVSVDPHITTHLLNVRRGIIVGLYARLAANVTSADLHNAYARYAQDPLIRVQVLTDANEATALSLRRVVGSARAHIAYKNDGDRLYVFSLIDNLMKGAASQAVENFNRLQGLPTWTSLTDVEGVL